MCSRRQNAYSAYRAVWNKNYIVMRTRRATRYNPYASRGRALVGAATAVAQRAYRSYTKTKRQRPSSSNVVTYQHDMRTDYKRKRMPAKKRRRWVSFVKKVRAVEFKDHANNFVVRSYKSPVITVTASSNATQGAQNMTNVGIYGIATGLEDSTIVGDVADIYNEWVQKGSSLQDGQKLCFVSAVSDVYVTNTGSNTMILDVYEALCKKDLPNNLNLFSTNSQSTFPNDQTGETGISSSKSGVTPFQLPLFTKYFKIMKKTKHVISPGQCITWQCRDPKNRVFKGADFQLFNGNSQAGKAWLTRMWTMVATGTELCTTNNISYTIAQSRVYNFKVLDQSAERSRYLNV